MEKLIHEDPVTGELSCNARDFDKFFPLLHAYEETGLTPEDIEQTMLRFSSFLMEMTGGRMSKTNYTVQAMVSEANDYQQQELDEIEKELAQVKAERDAAVRDLNLVAQCDTCMYKENTTVDPCEACTGDCYVWRGAKDTNVPGKTATDTNVGSKEEE